MSENKTEINDNSYYKEYVEQLKKLEEIHRKDSKRTIYFFAGIFLLFVAVIFISLVFIDGSFIIELRNGNASLLKNTDYLELIIPILISIAAAFIAFLGINRLKDMDAQVDQMRNTINMELEKEINRVASLRSDLSDHIDVAINAKTDTFAKEMEEKLKEASSAGEQKVLDGQKRALREIEDKENELSRLSEEIKDGWNSFDTRYKWLLSDEDKSTKEIFLKEIATVDDVYQAVEQMWNSKQKIANITELTKRYVNLVTDRESRIIGEADDYHNLIAEVARHRYYDLACEICSKGLSTFADNMDLLADWIEYGTKQGLMSEVKEQPLKQLLSIDKTLWNWRAFNFTVDYYLANGEFEEAEKLTDDFVTYLPYEERSYHCQAEVYEKRYAKEEGVQRTINVLRTALNKGINCPLCAHKLAEILCDIGKWEEALVTANRCIQELAEEQPSMNYAYSLYQRAMIEDHLSFDNKKERSQAFELASKAIADYQLAIKSRELSLTTYNYALVRRGLLRSFWNIEEDDDLSDEALQQILESLVAKANEDNP